MIDIPSTVNRVEVIDDTGRVYVKYGVTKAHYELQDDEQTLKLFVNWGDDVEVEPDHTDIAEKWKNAMIEEWKAALDQLELDFGKV